MSQSFGYTGSLGAQLLEESFQENLLDEIIKLSFYTVNQSVIEKYSITETTLKEKYEQLIHYGAGQYFRGHWVAASALVFSSTLEYLFDKRNEMSGRDEGQEIAYRLIEYFNNGEMGEITTSQWRRMKRLEELLVEYTDIEQHKDLVTEARHSTIDLIQMKIDEPTVALQLTSVSQDGYTTDLETGARVKF
ncbi:hypothetical protein OAC08_03110 [Pelagibacterales bacterium]|nr:hypothetical protein [Pelagibacterales bacterium]